MPIAAWTISGRYFAQKIKEAGLQISIFESAPKNIANSWKQDLQALGQWLLSLERPCALFACNDDRAEEIMLTCQAVGLKIPEDIAVLGIDNDNFICETVSPKLSSIKFETEKCIFKIATTLDKLMHGEHVEQHIFYNIPWQVEARQSTDLMNVSDQLVVDALKFIRNNSYKLIQIKDVASFTGVSDRELRRRFQKVLNRTVQYEITYGKVQYIKQLLIETELSTSQIAARLGYPPEGKYIARFFKKITGQTPFEYRNNNKIID